MGEVRDIREKIWLNIDLTELLTFRLFGSTLAFDKILTQTAIKK